MLRYENTNRSGRPERSDAARQQPSVALKPQDLAVLFKLVALGGQWLPYQEMAKQMYLSQFETHAAISGWWLPFSPNGRGRSVRPIMQVLHPFVFYGAAYVYPLCAPKSPSGLRPRTVPPDERTCVVRRRISAGVAACGG